MREPVKYTIAILIVLALQYLSFGLHYAALAHGGTAIPLVIAGIMVTISAVVFMEVRRSPPATRIVALVGVLFVALLCMGVFGDVAFR